MTDGATALAAAFTLGLAPPPRLTVSEWADQYRRLPTKGSGEPGAWRTSRVPYTREVMDCLSAQHPARRVVLMKSAQVAGTEIGLNWIGWFIATQRAPLMAVQPTTDVAERFSKQRLASMIDDCPPLRELIPPARSRDSGNTTQGIPRRDRDPVRRQQRRLVALPADSLPVPRRSGRLPPRPRR